MSVLGTLPQPEQFLQDLVAFAPFERGCVCSPGAVTRLPMPTASTRPQAVTGACDVVRSLISPRTTCPVSWFGPMSRSSSVRPRQRTVPGPGVPAEPTGNVGGGAAPTSPPEPATKNRPKRFHGSVNLDPARVGRDAGRIADEVIAHLVGLVGSTVKVTLEIEATVEAGTPENVVRTVTENSRTLKFTTHGFEEE
jgi:hypothetical protein